MNQISPYPLWLGHSEAGRDFKTVYDMGITALMQLAVEVAPPQPPRDLTVLHIPLIDGSGNRAELIYLACSTLSTLIRTRVPTLVTCDAGSSRAPAIAAGALAMVLREPPEDCLSRIVRQHGCDVSAGFWSEVVRLLPAVRL